MPRPRRNDRPGAWHHVFNRGLARRTLFESDRDVRKFLSLLARCARAGRIEVHSYCVLSTHFHLLLRSPEGELSNVMQWVENQYVRWFNRGRRRDGPLLRSRFQSKRADGWTYRGHLVRYIDFNAVEAGLVASPALYPHGSARHYARPAGPPWLTRTWVESEVGSIERGSGSRAPRYAERFGEPLNSALTRWIEQRAAAPADAEDPLDDLLAAAPGRVLAWMRRKAELADGGSIGAPLCTPESVDETLSQLRHERGDWQLARERGAPSALLHLRVGLLRELCAASLREIAAATELSINGAWNTAQRHGRLLACDDDYATAATELATRALHACHRSIRWRVAVGGGA